MLFASLPIKLTASDQGALAALTEARVLSERVGDRVWPGFTLGTQQILAYDGDRLQLLVGASGRPPRFVPVPAAGFGVLGHQGSLPQLARVRSPEILLGRSPAVALPYTFLESDDQPRPQSVFEPAFAAWQQRTFAGASAYRRLENLASPISSATENAAAELEDRLLADSLRSTDPGQRKADVREFLAVRWQRRAALSATTRRAEDLAESFLGLPQYVADAYSAYASADPGFLASAIDPARWKPWPASVAGVAGALELPLASREMAADRFQFTGLAEARLLDLLWGASWRARAQHGAPLDDLLARAVAMPWKRVSALLAAGRSAAGWDDLLLATRDPSRRFPSAYRAWLQSPGRKVTCWLTPVGSHLEVHYQARPIELDAQTLFAADLSAFAYGWRSLSLDVSGRAMLWHGPDIDWPYQRVSFYLPPGATVRLDGRPLADRDGTYPIGRELIVRAPGVELEVPTGRVLIHGRNLDIRPRY